MSQRRRTPPRGPTPTLTPATDNRNAPKPAAEDGEAARQHMWRLAAVYGAVGIEVAACVIVGALGGHYADGWLGATPWGFFIGTTLGCVAAGKAVARVMRLGRTLR